MTTWGWVECATGCGAGVRVVMSESWVGSRPRIDLNAGMDKDWKNCTKCRKKYCPKCLAGAVDPFVCGVCQQAGQ